MLFRSRLRRSEIDGCFLAHRRLRFVQRKTRTAEAARGLVGCLDFRVSCPQQLLRYLNGKHKVLDVLLDVSVH